MIENGRAKAAFDFCSKYKGTDVFKSYKNTIRKMPTMIQVNGYAGAVAFLFSKLDDEDKGYQFLYEDIQSWLKEQELISDDKESSLIKQIVQVDKQRYRQITAETMALLGWMKRFADGFHIKGDKG